MTAPAGPPCQTTPKVGQSPTHGPSRTHIATHPPCSASCSEPDPEYDDCPEGYPVVMKKLESKLSELGVDEEDDQSLEDQDEDDVEPAKPPNL